MRLLNYGRSGLLVELASLDEAIRLSADLDRHRPAGVTELVPGARTVLIRFDPDVTGPAVLAVVLEQLAGDRAVLQELAGRGDRAALQELAGRGDRAEPGDGAEAGAAGVVEIPVVYDGDDLEEVARITGFCAQEVVDRHCAARYLVAFTGFAPGFGYLSGGDPALRVPRRNNPRTRVPAGAVGLAGEFSGVYPRPGPGGWQLVGRTAVTMWDVERTPAALLRPGVRVTFRPVTS